MRGFLLSFSAIPLALVLGACSAGNSGSGRLTGGAGGASGGFGGCGGAGAVGGTLGIGGTGGSGATGQIGTCAEAEAAASYIGCDFWPTTTANAVWQIFDFAVVVANAGSQPADIVIERGGAQVDGGQVPPNGLAKFFLPWVPELKGPEFDNCGAVTPTSGSVRAPGGAYHLTSSIPVTVYQFSALEYRGQDGPPGKDWSSCPGNTTCPTALSPIGCFSFSNDASLLLPSTAMTATYRITGQRGLPPPLPGAPTLSPYVAVTGLSDGTTVNFTLPPTALVAPGGGLPGGGGALSFPINRGEVVQVGAADGTDFSGGLITASAPVQVISGVPCIQSPVGNIPPTPACDHIEESVFPAETLGQRYFVVSPTGALGNVVGHVVRIYGNIDGTTLQYPSGAPPMAPATINAGQVVDLGLVTQDFEIVGSASFAVGSFMLGGSLQDPLTSPPNQKGDPSMSMVTAVEQYRTKYVFLAPDDYDVSYVDIVIPKGANIFVDGQPVNGAYSDIGASFGVVRQPLGPGMQGAHILEADQPVGIQVMGYGSYTSYQYPGGSDLVAIAPPPPK